MYRTGRLHVKEALPSMKQPSGSSRKSSAPKKQKRAGERVFDVAADLFYRHSIRSVGVETIVEQAGVSKISLYRNFESKDDLIVAYLENRNAEYWKIVDQITVKHPDNPRSQLRALIGYIADRTTTPGYRGCPFINYAAEFPDPAHPGRRVAGANKMEMRREFSRPDGCQVSRPKPDLPPCRLRPPVLRLQLLNPARLKPRHLACPQAGQSPAQSAKKFHQTKK